MAISADKTTRKQVTVLFCDIVGYTERAIETDPEDLSEQIRRFQTLCAKVIQQYQGHVSHYFGDGIMAIFGHPLSNEFDVINAAHAGLGIIKQIKSDDFSVDTKSKRAIAVRIGIATGIVVVGNFEQTETNQDQLIFGEAPNLAARLQELAKPNTIVTALRTRRLIGSAFEFKDLGEFNLKGFKRAIPVWQIIKENTLKNQRAYLLERLTTPFVSRSQELSFILHSYQHAIQNKPIFIHICGEAGIGKSRLTHYFLDNLPQPATRSLQINCSPYYRATAFHPLIEECLLLMNINQQESDAEKVEKIKKTLLENALTSDTNLILLCEFLSVQYHQKTLSQSISAEEKYLKTIQLLTQFFVSLSKQKPLIIIVEDLHWADLSTIDFFDHMLKHLSHHQLEKGEYQLFVIQTSRNEFHTPWKQSDLFITLPLSGLSQKSSLEIVENVFSKTQLPEKIKQQLVEKSAGIPLYLEECSWDMLNQIYAQEKINQQDDFNVPDTLQDSLNARLDRLGQAKSLAQLASVFFQDFTHSTIKRLAQLNNIAVDENIDILIQAQMLELITHEDGDSYAFKHALFREAAYHSLLKKERKQYHQQIAELFISDDKSLIDKQPELLALHYEQSTEPEKAVELWLKSGQLAIARAEINNAKNHIEKGIKVLAQLDDAIKIKRHETTLRFTLAVCRTLRSGYFGDKVTDDFKRSMELADELKIAETQWTARYGYWRCLVCQAKFVDAMKISVSLNRLSESCQDRKLSMTATGIKGFTRMIDGKFHKADGYFKNAIAYYDENEDRNIGIYFGQDPYVTTQGLMAVNSLIQGNVEQSKQEIQTAISVARKINHPYTIAETLRVAAVHAQIANDQVALLTLSKETIELSSQFQFDGLLATSEIFFSYYQTHNHGDISYIPSIEENLERYKEKYALLFYPYFQALLAEAYLDTAQYQQAFTTAKHAYMLCEAYGEQWAMLPIIKTKILSALHGKLAHSEEIIQWYEQGITLAKKQHAGLYHFQLQSLMRLLNQHNLYKKAVRKISNSEKT